MLVQQLIASFITWDKFCHAGLRSCPNLASADTASLLESPEVEPILDLPNLSKRSRRDGDEEEEDEEVGDEEGGDMEGEEIPEDGEERNLLNSEPGRVVEDGGDEYLDYVKGLIS